MFVTRGYSFADLGLTSFILFLLYFGLGEACVPITTPLSYCNCSSIVLDLSLEQERRLRKIQDGVLHHAQEPHRRCQGKWEALQRDDESELFNSLSLGLTLGLVGKSVIIIYAWLFYFKVYAMRH